MGVANVRCGQGNGFRQSGADGPELAESVDTVRSCRC